MTLALFVCLAMAGNLVGTRRRSNSNSTKKNLLRGKSRRGIATCYMGPMFSGKTSKLQQQFTRYTSSGKRVLVVSHEKDTRSGLRCVRNHNLVALECRSVSRLGDHGEEWKAGFDVILIDEAQLFEVSDLGDFVQMCKDAGKIVEVFGLDRDYRRSTYPWAALLSHTVFDVCRQLTAFCKCGERARYTCSVTVLQDAFSLGGKENYSPVCHNCYPANGVEDHVTVFVTRTDKHKGLAYTKSFLWHTSPV